jgi:polysaccharide export outer membrane protein
MRRTLSFPIPPAVWFLCLGGLLSCFFAERVAAQASASLVLRTNDRIEVRVFQEEDLTQQVLVAPDGTVRLSLVGRIAVGGLSAEQAAARIRGAYADGYLIDPQVQVSVIQAAKRRVVVLGQVTRPGPVDLRSGERVSLLQAIAEVGGLTRLANARAVLVKRMSGGRERIFKVDVKALSTDPTLPPFYVEEGDVITVKESIF